MNDDRFILTLIYPQKTPFLLSPYKTHPANDTPINTY